MSDIATRFRETRAQTEAICDPLLVEDYSIQSMPDASPPKWHLAHTSWFFENFLIAPHLSEYKAFHKDFAFIFNSYYKSVGDHLERHRRGLLSRPTAREVFEYRGHVNNLLPRALKSADVDLTPIVELGIQHEQQHQELLLTDIKHNFWSNPLKPAYRSKTKKHFGVTAEKNHPSTNSTDAWYPVDGGIYEAGFSSEMHGLFSFDNEGPRHSVYLQDFKIQKRLITNHEFLEFIQAGGYENPALWLSHGWDLVNQNRWKMPLYWISKKGAPEDYQEMTLFGVQPLDLDSPVTHISFYEADAFARWRGARLPTEEEWEVFAERFPVQGSFLESGDCHPNSSASNLDNSYQLWGKVWQWTSSAYRPYPGFKPLPDALGEYNGKFMSNQMVLRGGSCATPKSHIRSTYRNFFAPESRWQFSGIRLAL